LKIRGSILDFGLNDIIVGHSSTLLPTGCSTIYVNATKCFTTLLPKALHYCCHHSCWTSLTHRKLHNWH